MLTINRNLDTLLLEADYLVTFLKRSEFPFTVGGHPHLLKDKQLRELAWVGHQGARK